MELVWLMVKLIIAFYVAQFVITLLVVAVGGVIAFVASLFKKNE